MFKNKNIDGTLNLAGGKIAELRKAMKLSQRQLADKLQLMGLDFSKNAIQQIESRKRFITDIELKVFCQFFAISSETLLGLSLDEAS